MERLTTGYGLVEGPVWDEQRGLLFSDVHGGGVYVVTDDGAVTTVVEHRRGIGGMALHANGLGLVISGRNVAFKSFDGGPTIELCPRHDDEGGVGFNDLGTDAAGRVYVGELAASPFADDAGQREGWLWMIDLDGSVHRLADGVRLSNGIGLSPDGRTLHHSDTLRHAVLRHEVHDDGTLGPREVFADLGDGMPDGLAVASDGSVWVALAGEGQGVVVLEPDGTERTRLAVPQKMATSVCFGGDGLTRLYVVTGSDGEDSDRAGSVWVTEVDVPGLPVPPARVPLPSSDA